MPLPGTELTRGGIFRAHPTYRKVVTAGQNGLCALQEAYAIWDEQVDGQWIDISAQGLAIEAFHYIEKKDGTLNETTIKKLREAYGWDGRDPAALEAPVADDHMVKLMCEVETYNGKTRVRVKWLDAHDSIGGAGNVGVPDPGKLASLSAKLRANAGGVPANPPKPPGRPVAVKPAAEASPAAENVPF